MVFIHSFRSDLQFVLSTEHISPRSLGVRPRLTKELCELGGGDDLAQSSRGPLDVISVERRCLRFVWEDWISGGPLPYRL